MTLDNRVKPVMLNLGVCDIPSHIEYVKEILSYLNEDENRSIGIVGPIGVGKTVVLNMLNNHFYDVCSSPLFELVIWTTTCVGEQDKIIDMLQVMIMERLYLTKEKNVSIEQNADIISAAIMHKRYLLLVDQLSSPIDFELVGIHKHHRFSKVVVASSSKNVVVDRQVEILPLSNDDSLLYLQKFCDTSYNRCFKIIAEHIVASCGGLPQVIKAIGIYLKGEKDIRIWRHASRIIKCKDEMSGNIENLKRLDNAYKSIYDKLETSSKKCLVLAASLTGDNIDKNYLVECWNACKFLQVDVCGKQVLQELTDEYLLENCSDMHVKVPVFVRRMVLAQKDPPRS